MVWSSAKKDLMTHNLTKLSNTIITFNKWIGQALSCKPKIPFGLPTIGKILSSNTVKTLWAATSWTSSKDRQIMA